MSASHVVYLKFGITSANTVFSNRSVKSDLLPSFTTISNSFPLHIPLVLGKCYFRSHKAVRKLRNILHCTLLNFWVQLHVKTQKWSNPHIMYKGHTSINEKDWPTAAIGHELCSGSIRHISHCGVARKRNWIQILEGIPRLWSLCFRIRTHCFCESVFAGVTPFTEVSLRLDIVLLLSLAHAQQHSELHMTSIHYTHRFRHIF